MPDEMTRADALQVFLTGASSHDGAQTDHDLSLGNHKSSTEVQPYTWEIADPISNVSIDYISGASGLGAGSLTASDDDDLKWTPADGSQGVAVTIANGETKIVEGGGADGPHQYVRVTRTSAVAMTGTATVTTSYSLNNVHGFDDVSSAEQAAGDTEYRCVCVENVHPTATIKDLTVHVGTLGTQRTTDTAQLGASGAGTVQTSGSLADWPDVGYCAIKTAGGSLEEIVYYSSRTATTLTVPAAGRGLLGTSASAGSSDDTMDAIPGIAIGLDAPTSQPSGTFVDQTGAGEGSAPGGVSFSTPIVVGDALSIGDLAATYINGVWIKREVPVGSEARSSILHSLEWRYDAA